MHLEWGRRTGVQVDTKDADVRLCPYALYGLTNPTRHGYRGPGNVLQLPSLLLVTEFLSFKKFLKELHDDHLGIASLVALKISSSFTLNPLSSSITWSALIPLARDIGKVASQMES